MADIAQLLANSAQTNADFDFNKVNKSYFEGRDQFAKNDLRDAFRGGVPTDANGQIDYSAIMKTLLQKGDIANGVALIGATDGQQDRAMYSGGGVPPAQPAIVSPPSTNRGASVAVAPPLNKGGEVPQGQPQGQPGGVTPAAFLQSQGIQPGYNMEVALASFKRAGIEPDQPFNPNDPAISSKLGPVVQRLKGVGQVQPPQPGDNPPQAPQPQAVPAPLQPTPAQIAAQNDPELKRLRFLSGSPNKAVAESARAELKMKLEGQQPTNEIKEYEKGVSQGFKGTFEEWQNRKDDNATQRDILGKSLIPRIDKSQETASAARDDIDAIHRSREQLDKSAGVFSGAFADKKQQLAKIASALGIADSEKITNTEAYKAAIGARVAAMVKAFGSGTAISDGDRRFAAEMAGGQATLDERSMRRILDIGERAARGKIDYHNKFVDKAVAANEGLKSAKDSFIVTAPGQYQKLETKSAGPQEGATAFNPKTKERIKLQGGKWVPYA